MAAPKRASAPSLHLLLSNLKSSYYQITACSCGEMRSEFICGADARAQHAQGSGCDYQLGKGSSSSNMCALHLFEDDLY